jgi:hypothetical protein
MASLHLFKSTVLVKAQTATLEDPTTIELARACCHQASITDLAKVEKFTLRVIRHWYCVSQREFIRSIKSTLYISDALALRVKLKALAKKAENATAFVATEGEFSVNDQNAAAFALGAGAGVDQQAEAEAEAEAHHTQPQDHGTQRNANKDEVVQHAP